jgi:signal transduction histidine kinase
MNIRTKLTVRFILITAIIILLASILIYVFSAEYRERDFYERLANKANNTAKLLIEVDEVDAELLRRIEQDNPVSLPNEKILIFNYQDSLLFSTDEDRGINITKSFLDQIRLEDRVTLAQNDFEVLGFLFKGRYDRFVVIAAATDVYGFKRLRNLIYILLLVFAISIVIVTVSGWIYAGRALYPISTIVQQVRQVSAANLSYRVDEGNGKDEIAELAQTFNSMLASIETSFVTQKNFIANASHELRTPLTSITGQLEVILMGKRSEDEYNQAINSVLEDIKHLNSLSNRLLLLAQTTSPEREKRMSSVRIDEIIWQAQDDLIKHHPEFQIAVDLNEQLDDEESLTIKADEQLIRTAFSNLMENACKYANDKTCNVFIDHSRFGITVTVKDKGIGIPESDMPKIFDPFYRGRNTKDIKGHGIGLSMVKGIIKIHDGTIQIQTAEGHGTKVTVTLPNHLSEVSN